MLRSRGEALAPPSPRPSRPASKIVLDTSIRVLQFFSGNTTRFFELRRLSAAFSFQRLWLCRWLPKTCSLESIAYNI